MPLVPGTVFAAPPTVATMPATSPDGYNWTFHGTVNSQGLSANYHFEYTHTGKVSPGIRSTPNGALPASVIDQGVSAALPAPLAFNVFYRFRIIATNADGTTAGQYLEFQAPRYLDCVLVNRCPFPSWRAPMITNPKKQRLTTRKKRRLTTFSFCAVEIISGPLPTTDYCASNASFTIAFYCSIDGKAPQLCHSPFKVRLDPGVHRFRVFASEVLRGAQSTTAESRVRVRRAH